MHLHSLTVTRLSTHVETSQGARSSSRKGPIRIAHGPTRFSLGSIAEVCLIETRTTKSIPCPHLHLYREGYGDRRAMPLPAGRFSDAGDSWLLLLEFMQFVNVTAAPDI